MDERRVTEWRVCADTLYTRIDKILCNLALNTARERVILDDRVRDMIHLLGSRRYVLYLEGDSYEFGTIALLTANP